MLTENEVIMDLFICFETKMDIPYALARLATNYKINIETIKKVWSDVNGKTSPINGGITGEEEE
jgi:hypothetical protein